MTFPKDEMHAELRIIFLFKGDDLILSFGDQLAESALGFTPSRAAMDYCKEDPLKVDLSRFPITQAISTGYDFAFRPSLLNGALDSSLVQDLLQFRDNLPRSGGAFHAGEIHPFSTPDGLCWTCIDALDARWRLEWEEDATATFTIRDLALLAGMTEGAVRNALADKSDNGLRAIPASKPISVNYDEAKRWLVGRRGFVPTPTNARSDAHILQLLSNARSAEALSKLLRDLLLARYGSLRSAAEALGWNVSEVEPWCRGTFDFDLDMTTALARVVDIELPLLAGKALELSLRRRQR